MVVALQWSVDKIALMIMDMVMNKFDCFIVIDGNRGLGKSTLAYKVSKKVSNYFRVLVRETGGKDSPYYKYYEFFPKKQLEHPKKYRYVIYTRNDVINVMNDWRKTAIADEMINVSFNRDFQEDGQKNLVKIINMNRDHCNLLIACVPSFQTIDNQMKNLCKIRFTVVKRGLAIIQTPNKSLYSTDKWDTANNERIERKWFQKGTGLPKYTQLNTFRGFVKFGSLSKEEQRIYDQIKTNERSLIAKDLGVTEGELGKEKVDFKDEILEKLQNGLIKNRQVIEGYAYANKITPDSLIDSLRRKLAKQNKNPKVSTYFTDKNARDKPDKIPNIHSFTP